MTDDAQRPPDPRGEHRKSGPSGPASGAGQGGTVPQWLRTTIVAVMAAAFLVHVGYDAFDKNYDSFQTSFLILGFVGLALGYDVIGRR